MLLNAVLEHFDSRATVERETSLPGAVLTRVAASHIRVGTFQFFAARRDIDGLRLLADHVIARHYPDAGRADQTGRGRINAGITLGRGAGAFA